MDIEPTVQNLLNSLQGIKKRCSSLFVRDRGDALVVNKYLRDIEEECRQTRDRLETPGYLLIEDRDAGSPLVSLGQGDYRQDFYGKLPESQGVSYA